MMVTGRLGKACARAPRIAASPASAVNAARLVIMRVIVAFERAALAIGQQSKAVSRTKLDHFRIASQRLYGRFQKHFEIRPDPEHDGRPFEHPRFRRPHRIGVR